MGFIAHAIVFQSYMGNEGVGEILLSKGRSQFVARLKPASLVLSVYPVVSTTVTDVLILQSSDDRFEIISIKSPSGFVMAHF